ncbi:MAG: DoxX family protein [Chryseotalea sp.]
MPKVFRTKKSDNEAMEREMKNVLGKILGVLFILSAIPKAIGSQMAVDNFNKWLLGDEWRYLVALVEILAGLLMFSKWERYGTIILLGIMPAATLVHIRFQEWVMLPMPIIFGVLLLYYDKKMRP